MAEKKLPAFPKTQPKWLAILLSGIMGRQVWKKDELITRIGVEWDDYHVHSCNSRGVDPNAKKKPKKAKNDGEGAQPTDLGEAISSGNKKGKSKGKVQKMEEEEDNMDEDLPAGEQDGSPMISERQKRFDAKQQQEEPPFPSSSSPPLGHTTNSQMVNKEVLVRILAEAKELTNFQTACYQAVDELEEPEEQLDLLVSALQKSHHFAQMVEESLINLS